MISIDSSENIKAFKLKIIKNKWFILIILLVIGGFYWFQIRPNQIKIKCEQKARILVGDIMKENNSFITNSNFTQRVDEFYKLCLHGNGL